MSSRAIRALRGDLDPLINNNLASLEEDEDEDELIIQPKQKPTFAFVVDDDDDDDDESNSSSSSDSSNEDTRLDNKDEKEVNSTDHVEKVDKKSVADKDDDAKLPSDLNEQRKIKAEEVEKEEDLDALLNEFQQKDILEENDDYDNLSGCEQQESSPYDIILDSFDARDLDYDYTMRTSLVAATSTTESQQQQQKQQQKRSINSRVNNPLFGPPRDGWIRPPRLVGGGIGMEYYTTNSNNEKYCKFIHSDNYERDVQDFYLIKQSGDINAMVMFVAHHPYVTSALLQLSKVLYETNHTAEGFAFLKRILWIYEISSLNSFINQLVNDNTVPRMDKNKPENDIFFQALFKLIHVSHIAGLSRTALAGCRLLLALDPVRDPMNVLIALDYHALSVGTTSVLKWMIKLVDIVPIIYRGDDNNTTTADDNNQCSLCELPNWSYSYALALFQLHKLLTFDDNDNDDTNSLKQRSDEAIQSAISRYPAVVGLLLQNLQVDTTGRSFQRDWVTVLDYGMERARQLARVWHNASTNNDPVVLSATMQTCDKIMQIFVQQNARLWGEEDVLQWLYDNFKDLQSNASKNDYANLPSCPNPAILRYSNIDPADYDNKIQQLPAEMNILDPNALAYAMNMDPNRPRFLRQQHRQQQLLNQNNELVNNNGNNGLLVPRHLLGPPTNNVDPDWPMLEVFWRSFLPWNHVDGIPPPRR